METYGTDKPDLRFDMPLFEFKDYVEQSDFNVLKSTKNNGRVKAIVCPNGDSCFKKGYR